MEKRENSNHGRVDEVARSFVELVRVRRAWVSYLIPFFYFEIALLPEHRTEPGPWPRPQYVEALAGHDRLSGGFFVFCGTQWI